MVNLLSDLFLLRHCAKIRVEIQLREPKKEENSGVDHTLVVLSSESRYSGSEEMSPGSLNDRRTFLIIFVNHSFAARFTIAASSVGLFWTDTLFFGVVTVKERDNGLMHGLHEPRYREFPQKESEVEPCRRVVPRGMLNRLTTLSAPSRRQRGPRMH